MARDDLFRQRTRGVVKYVSLTPEEQTFLKTCWTLKSWLKKLGLLLIVFAVKQFLRFAGARGVGYYAVGARPVGALFLGAYGDRCGRKAALTLSILLMTLGTGNADGVRSAGRMLKVTCAAATLLLRFDS